MRRGPRGTAVLLATCLWVGCLGSSAGELRLKLSRAGQPVTGAVVELLPDGGSAPKPMDAVMDQVNTEFVPRQLVVTRGSAVSFPNSDVTRHQVYSFSPAKRFELPLYSGTPPDPVVFESAGVVTLGCNIHDAMIGFIVVVDSDHWAVTDAGGAVRFEVPAGRYSVRLWHERMQGEQPVHPLQVSADGTQHLEFELALGPPPPPRGSDRLRALQERLRERQRETD